MEVLLDVLVTLIAASVIGAYSWSVKAHFRSEAMPLGARVIATVVTMSALSMLALTWLVPQPAVAQALGASVMLASAALFAWAIRASRRADLRFIYDREHPSSIIEEGPYRLVRHPFYVSYVLFWLGWAVATWSIVSAVPVIALTWLYVRAARLEEMSFAMSPMAGSYAGYQQRVGFFVPRLR